MIKATAQLMARLHEEFVGSVVHAALSRWYRANICAPEPVEAKVHSPIRLGYWQDLDEFTCRRREGWRGGHAL